MMKDNITVGQLRKALEGVPDDLPVVLTSDNGVDCGEDDAVVIEGAMRVKYKTLFEDVDYFAIYANFVEKEDELSG